MKEALHTPDAPGAIGPYSQAIRCGEWLFTSGQIPLDPATGQLVGGDAAVQAERVLKNLEAVFAAAGMTLGNAVKTTVFLKNMADFGAVNEVYGRFFPAPYPARSCVEVARLPKDVLVEIEAVGRA